ncbi:conserved protein of unknown function [Methanocaldococcus lauensis]|uniref:Uncharacterized protein n=1 Tax=Methanocaldococcus lauensis TaxID=2546128 RepID=A0A8D6PSP8_9EURY|nr:hypothetical protein [Methanocaldococcus lauensis]CAB3288161.1 conserved protein of unknown function [Methanocaldococcus lauensis]CAB3289491.1 conserved protein of unknown function [Methanocaldococcus lauensis]
MIKLIKKRGQISIDLIMAIFSLLIVSLFIYNTELSYTDSTTDALIVNRLYDIADTLENYAILAYTNNVSISIKLKPIGTLRYNLTIKDKTINVIGDTYILITPNKNGVILSGFTQSPINVGNNIVISANVDGKILNVSKKLNVNISFS